MLAYYIYMLETTNQDWWCHKPKFKHASLSQIHKEKTNKEYVLVFILESTLWWTDIAIENGHL